MCRLMTYHVYFENVDVSHVLPIPRLWELVLQNREYIERPPIISTHNDTFGIFSALHGRRDSQQSREHLREVIETLVTQNAEAVHMYSGMFDSRFVLHADIEKLLKNNLQEAYPIALRIESLDSVVLLYSLSVSLMALFFFSLRKKLKVSSNYDEADLLKNGEIPSDLLIFDAIFWFVLFFYAYIMIDASSAVTVPIVSLWQALVYVTPLYVANYPTQTPKHVIFALLGAWGMHVMLLTSSNHSSVSIGGPFLVSHLCTAIFTYISVAEHMTVVKFCNQRLWSAVFFSVLFLFVYCNNVIFIPGTQA